MNVERLQHSFGSCTVAFPVGHREINEFYSLFKGRRLFLPPWQRWNNRWQGLKNVTEDLYFLILYKFTVQKKGKYEDIRRVIIFQCKEKWFNIGLQLNKN